MAPAANEWLDRADHEPPPIQIEPSGAAFSWPPTSSEDDQPSGIAESLSVIAIALNATAFDGIVTGDWAADCACVQAMIEHATEKIEWRIATVVESEGL